MTATSGQIGYSAALTVEGGAVGETTDFTLSLDQENADLTNRDSNYWRQIVTTTRSWTMSGNGNYVATDVGKKVLVNHWENRSPTTITCVMTLADGSITATGEAIVTNLTFNAPFADKADFSFTLEGTDALTLSSS